MGSFRDKAHALEIIGGFMKQEAAGTEQQLLAGSGLIMAYTLSEPDLRIVIDASVEPKPGHAFDVYFDNANGPEPKVEFFMSADTYDELFSGKVQAMALLMTGKVKSQGDITAAMRLLPSMGRAIPHYKKYREQHG